MPRIIVAPDSFKESLTAAQAAYHIAAGVQKVLASVQVVQVLFWSLKGPNRGLIDNGGIFFYDG